MADSSLLVSPHPEFPQNASKQLTLFVSDYERLCEQRDIAAYRALGAMAAAMCFCRQGRPEDALTVLTSALARYERADEKLQQLKKGDAPCRSH